ncbi:MAG: YeeE/YedE family protein [Bacteroidales bacterium]|nr:YeeE/YedE family protein [Bacteroidales bacterium]
MEKEVNKRTNPKKYKNPYLMGVLLGFVLIAAFYFSGRGLGASGAPKRVMAAVVEVVAPQHAEKSEFYSKYVKSARGPWKDWLNFEVLGVIIGGFISGTLSGRLKVKVEHSPKITSRKRLAFALIGGILFEYGASMARGCTSGAALSGMAVLATGGLVTMFAIFGGAYLFAYFFRKLWI